MTNREEQNKEKFANLIAQAWSNEEFKKRLIDNPMEVFQENGLELIPGVEVRIVEDTDKVCHFILPMKPDDELIEEELRKMTGESL